MTPRAEALWGHLQAARDAEAQAAFEVAQVVAMAFAKALAFEHAKAASLSLYDAYCREVDGVAGAETIAA